MNIQPGNLIKTTRPRIGCPEGTLGLVTERLVGSDSGIVIYVVALQGMFAWPHYRARRFIEQDLEVVS